MTYFLKAILFCVFLTTSLFAETHIAHINNQVLPK